MNSPSRHGRQGGFTEADGVQPEVAAEIIPYKEQRNRRKKALHDEVQTALLDSGFEEAAELCSLFTKDLSDKEAVGEKHRKDSCAHCKILG